MKDLFGNEVAIEDVPSTLTGAKKKRDETPKGYAAAPGSGPRGETCKTCKHSCRLTYSKSYWKCALRKPWTNSYGTDIRLKAPACSRWEAEVAV